MKPGLLLAIAYLGFISLGLPDPLAGVAWPSVRDTFALPQSGFGLIFIALGCGYCVSGFFGGQLTLALGLGNLLWISSGCVALAMLGSGLAAAWPAFVACAVLWGIGSGGIDAGLNAYASRHFSARHMNWLHACYSLGATLGPLLMTTMLLNARSWRLGYLLVGGLLLGMTAIFLLTRRRWNEPPAIDVEAKTSVNLRTALASGLVWLQIVLFFLYVGLEFTVGQWCFTLFTEARGVSAEVAGILAGCYYAAIGVGRILAGVVTHHLELDRLLRLAMLTVLAGAALLALGSPAIAAFGGLILVGLGLAPIFPCLMARTPQRLQPGYATHAVGFQVSAGMLGAALMPGLAGLLVEWLGLEVIGWFAITLAAMLAATHEVLVRVAR